MAASDESDLAAFLSSINLSVLSVSLEDEHGFDLESLHDLSLEEFDSLATAMNMKFGHRTKLKKALGLAAGQQSKAKALPVLVAPPLGSRAHPKIECQASGQEAAGGLVAAAAPAIGAHTGISGGDPRGGGGTSTSSGAAAASAEEHSAPQEATLTLNQPGAWDFFISYTQRDPEAKVLASELHTESRDAGSSSWLDVKMRDKSEAAMEEGVTNCRIFVPIITEEYFCRPYCVKEFRWARTHGKLIQPVVSADDKKKIGEFVSLAPPDLADIGKVDFIHLDRSDIDFWKLGCSKVLSSSPFQLPPYIQPPEASLQLSSLGSALSATVQESKTSGVRGCYLCVAIQPAPVLLHGSISGHSLAEHAEEMENAFLSRESEWRGENMAPVRICANDRANLLPLVRSSAPRVIVYGAVGYGWDVSSTPAVTVACLESALRDQANTPLFVICMKYGARRMAVSLSASTGATVAFVKLDLCTENGISAFFDTVGPIVRAMDKEGATFDEISTLVERIAASRKPHEVGVIIPASMSERAPWVPPSIGGPSSSDLWVVNDAKSTCRANFGGHGMNFGIFASDVEHVQIAASRLKKLSRLAVCCDGKNAINRSRSVALEICRLFFNSVAVKHLYRVSNSDELAAAVGYCDGAPGKMLLWLDIAVDNRDSSADLAASISKSVGKFPQASLLLTSALPTHFEAISEALAFEEYELESEGGASEVEASALHDEVRIIAKHKDGTPRSLLDIFEADELVGVFSALFAMNNSIAGMFEDDDLSLFIRISVSDIGRLHEFRDEVLQGDLDARVLDAMKEIQPKEGNSIDDITVTIDRSHFAELYESCILQLDKLTPHQKQKLDECRRASNVHIAAPAGAGKTFISLNRILEVIVKDEANTALFVARNVSLCYFVVKWICSRIVGSAKKRRLLKRVCVMFEPFEDGPRAVSVRNGRIIQTERDIGDAHFTLVVVDEAHHLYSHAETLQLIEAQIEASTDRLLLSDVSQSSGMNFPFPNNLLTIHLDEVVRCSKRVVAGSTAFAIGPNKPDIKCHHSSTGPPLKTFLFDSVGADGRLVETYAKEVLRALKQVIEEFPGLSLHDRMMIVVPDDNFKTQLRPLLENELRTAFHRRFELVDSVLASSIVAVGEERSTEWIIFDSIDRIDGLERLIVLCVGLDSFCDSGRPDKNLQTRSTLYRALTRAHMVVGVINELVQGGWLEFLGLLKLTGDFNSDQELDITEEDKAGALVLKERIRSMQERVEAFNQKCNVTALNLLAGGAAGVPPVTIESPAWTVRPLVPPHNSEVLGLDAAGDNNEISTNDNNDNGPTVQEAAAVDLLNRTNEALLGAHRDDQSWKSLLRIVNAARRFMVEAKGADPGIVRAAEWSEAQEKLDTLGQDSLRMARACISDAVDVCSSFGSISSTAEELQASSVVVRSGLSATNAFGLDDQYDSLLLKTTLRQMTAALSAAADGINQSVWDPSANTTKRVSVNPKFMPLAPSSKKAKREMELRSKICLHLDEHRWDLVDGTALVSPRNGHFAPTLESISRVCELLTTDYDETGFELELERTDFLRHLAHITTDCSEAGLSDELRELSGIILLRVLRNKRHLCQLIGGEFSSELVEALRNRALASDGDSGVSSAGMQFVVRRLLVAILKRWENPRTIQSLVELLDESTVASSSALAVLSGIAQSIERNGLWGRSDISLGRTISLFYQFLSSVNAKDRSNAALILCSAVQGTFQMASADVECLFTWLPTLGEDTSASIRRYACGTFVYLLDNYPSVVHSQLESVLHFMLQASQDSSQQVAFQAMKFWIPCCDSEILSPGLQDLLPRLVPLLLKNMVYSTDEIANLESQVEIDSTEPDSKDAIRFIFRNASEKDDEEDHDNENDDGEGESEKEIKQKNDYRDTMRKRSAQTLDKLTERFGDEVAGYILPALQAGLGSGAVWEREAAILALGAMQTGCSRAVEGHLPQLFPYLLEHMGHPNPKVREISCWTVGRYLGWVVATVVEQCGGENKVTADSPPMTALLQPVIEQLLARAGDGNKLVQQFACSSLSILFETCDHKGCAAALLPPRLRPILEHLLRCLDSYQVKSSTIMLDTIGTLCDAAAPHNALSGDQDLAQALLASLLQRWQATADDDMLLLPLLECLSCACAACGMQVQQTAPQIGQWCCRTVETIVVAHTTGELNPATGEPYDKQFVASSLDLIDGLARALGENFGALLATPGCVGHVGNGGNGSGTGGAGYFFELLEQCCRDDENDVRRAALCLVGDLALQAPETLRPYAPRLAPLLVENLQLTDGSFGSCVSNAAWALGEVTVALGFEGGLGGNPATLEGALRRLAGTMTDVGASLDPDITNSPSLLANVAVAIGRLGAAAPQRIAQAHGDVVGHMAEDWLNALHFLEGGEERDHAFRGLVLLATQEPLWQHLVAGRYPAFLRAVASWEMVDHPMKPELRQGLQQVISAASARMGTGHDPSTYLNATTIPEENYRTFLLSGEFVFA